MASLDDRPRYMISVAADLVGMHPQTLRIYEAKGLVRPVRTPGGTRLYSELALEDEMAKLRARMERLEREMREQVDQVHKQYRRDLVLYSDAQREYRLPRRR